MNLEDSLRGEQSGANSARLTERLQTEEAGTVEPVLQEVRREGVGAVDPYGDLKRRVQSACIVRLGPWLFSKNDEPAALAPKVRAEVRAEIDRDETPLALVDRERLITEITADILGYGPIEPFPAPTSARRQAAGRPRRRSAAAS